MRESKPMNDDNTDYSILLTHLYYASFSASGNSHQYPSAVSSSKSSDTTRANLMVVFNQYNIKLTFTCSLIADRPCSKYLWQKVCDLGNTDRLNTTVSYVK